MIDTIYFEEQVADHPRANALFSRFGLVGSYQQSGIQSRA